jgi:hypothetical protein
MRIIEQSREDKKERVKLLSQSLPTNPGKRRTAVELGGNRMSRLMMLDLLFFTFFIRNGAVASPLEAGRNVCPPINCFKF